MTGNSFGQLFRVSTFGESHGPAMGCIIDGCPPGLILNENDIQSALDRRRPGHSRYVSQRKEPDQVKILSGIFENQTTGTPIALLVENLDQKEKDYRHLKDCFRPGHADYSYYKKYGIRDHRGGGRSSARETVMRVAAAAIAQKYLEENYQIKIRACLIQLGHITIKQINWDEVNNNEFFCPDNNKIAAYADLIEQIRKRQDSIGGKILIEATAVPAGLGEPVFAKLDAEISSALMSINAVKGVEIGAGFSCVKQLGSEHRDELTKDGFLSNHAGGILGGISTGQDIVARIALKPTPSITQEGKTINLSGESLTLKTTGRHDPCVAIRAVPVAEAMLALVLMDHIMRHRAQNQ